jgi:hypothetical protein
MMKRLRSPFRKLKNDSGQALPWMVFLSALIIGSAGITVDLGRAMVADKELQASSDAAALAGAYALPLPTATTDSVKAAITSYSAGTDGANRRTTIPNVNVEITFKCLTTLANQGVYCSGSPTGYNAIQVKQTATLNTYFMGAFALFGVKGAKTVNVGARATAAMRGSSNSQYNVAVIIDTTASMGSSDSDASCNSTRIKCAEQGVRTLVQSLTPCAPSSGTTCVPFDQVSLFAFPNVQASTASKDTTCPTSNPTILNYVTPTAGATWSAPTGTAGTYQITTYLSNYSATNTAGGALNTSSQVVIAAGGKTSCSGMATPGGTGTYYAGAIYAAQSSLIAAQKANPGSLNALVILSDGDASSSKFATATNNGVTYPSTIDQCQQAITAAQYASSHGTTVYTIAYGAGSSGCSTDTTGSLKGISPCTTLQKMATAASNFYSDATASQNKGQCTSSANPNLSLNQIFKQVAVSLTVARLLPDDMT